MPAEQAFSVTNPQSLATAVGWRNVPACVPMEMIGAGLRGLPRQQQIEAATAQLENYSSAA
jgi:hypothetical protein